MRSKLLLFVVLAGVLGTIAVYWGSTVSAVSDIFALTEPTITLNEKA